MSPDFNSHHHKFFVARYEQILQKADRLKLSPGGGSEQRELFATMFHWKNHAHNCLCEIISGDSVLDSVGAGDERVFQDSLFRDRFIKLGSSA